MDIKRTLVAVAACALIGSAGSSAYACDQAPKDQVAASFQRMLDHEPSRTAPAVPAGTAADPLRTAVSAVLWLTEPPAFHLPVLHARAEARSEARH
jgi:hypothetical protein